MKHVVEYLGITEGTQRLVSFSDAIFAFSMTLLALSFPIPQLGITSGESLAIALRHQWPQYISFLISFLSIGIVWLNHHEMFRFIERSTQIFLLLNLLLLMSIVLMPYSTAILGYYLKVQNNQVTATALYSLTLLFMGIMVNAVWLYARHKKLINEQCNPEAVSLLTRSYLLSPLLRGFALVMAFICYPASLVIHALISTLFLIPTAKRPIYLPSKKH